MPKRGTLLLLAAIAPWACAIPERDNPFDPAVAPRAKLVIRAVGETDTVINQGGRNTPFLLDASESKGGSGGLRYAFELENDQCAGRAADSRAFQTPPTEGATLETTLPVEEAAFGEDGTGDVIRIVCVRVTDREGHIGVASAAVVVRNEEPAPDAGGTMFVARGPVVLDACGGRPDPDTCTTTDADGDPLAFSWARVAGAGPEPVPLDEDGRRARFDVPSTGDFFRFQVTATDGLARESGSLTVSVSKQVWVSTRFPSRLLRVFPDHPRATTGYVTTAGLVSFPNGQMGGAFAPGDGTFLAAGDGIIAGPAPPIVRLDGAFRAVERWYPAPTTSPPASKDAFTVPSLTDRCAVVRYDDAGETTSVAAFVVLAPGGGNPVEAKRDDGAPFGQTGPAGATAVLPRDDGRCWTIGTRIGILDTAGSWTPVSSDNVLLGRFDSAAALPDGRVCVLGEDAAGTPGLRCLEGSSLVLLPDPTFDFTYARAMTAHPDGNRLLVHSINTDTVLAVDPETGEASEEPGIPAFSGQLNLGGNPIFVSDRETASLWFVDGLSQVLFRYEYLGDRWTFAGSIPPDAIIGDTASGIFSWHSLAVDPVSGNAVATFETGASGDVGLVAKIPFHLRSVERLPGLVGERARLAGDPTRGTVWYSDDGDPFAGGFSVRNDRGEIVVQQGPPDGPIEKWRPAVAIPTGGAWVGHNAFQGVTTLRRVDPYLAVEEEIAIGPGIVGEPDLVGDLSLSASGRWLCAATTRSPEGSFGSTDQTIWRCDALAGTCAAVGSLPDASAVASPALGLAPVRVAAADDGACYVAHLPDGAPYATWTAGRVKPAAATVDPAFTVTFRFNDILIEPQNGCSPIALDPRDASLWILRRDDDGPLRVATGDAATGGEVIDAWPSLGDSVNCLALSARCSDPNDEACLDAWYVTQESTNDPAFLKRAEGTSLDAPTDSIELGSGTPQSLDVR